jgi:hypothetical protein
MLRIALFLAAFCTSIYPALAAAPAGLLNKTVRVSFGLLIPGKSAVGTTNGSGRTMSVILYVSSAGRIFAKRVSRASRGEGEDRLGGPESNAGNFHFAGSALVATSKFGNAAGQMTIKFDGGFQSCSADVMVGGENGAPMTWVGLNGEKYTQTGRPTISSVTCSVQNGNAFAG